MVSSPGVVARRVRWKTVWPSFSSAGSSPKTLKWLANSGFLARSGSFASARLGAQEDRLADGGLAGGEARIYTQLTDNAGEVGRLSFGGQRLDLQGDFVAGVGDGFVVPEHPEGIAEVVVEETAEGTTPTRALLSVGHLESHHGGGQGDGAVVLGDELEFEMEGFAGQAIDGAGAVFPRQLFPVLDGRSKMFGDELGGQLHSDIAGADLYWQEDVIGQRDHIAQHRLLRGEGRLELRGVADRDVRFADVNGDGVGRIGFPIDRDIHRGNLMLSLEFRLELIDQRDGVLIGTGDLPVDDGHLGVARGTRRVFAQHGEREVRRKLRGGHLRGIVRVLHHDDDRIDKRLVERDLVRGDLRLHSRRTPSAQDAKGK